LYSLREGQLADTMAIGEMGNTAFLRPSYGKKPLV